MQRDLKFEWLYPNTPEEVWHCLTTSELIEKWLMTNDFKLQLGHRFQFRAKPMPGWSGIVDCEITEIIPNRKLSYSWVSGPKPGSDKIKTVVTWQLIPEKNSTRLILEHTGFEGFRAWMTSFILGSGWKKVISLKPLKVYYLRTKLMKKNKTDVFAAIGDPTRRQILFLLTAGALNIHVLAANFTVSRPAISKHVKALAEAGLVSVEEIGRERLCSLDVTGFNELKDWLQFYDQFWKNNLQRLGKVLKEQSGKKLKIKN